jgi:hypothetical protein
MKYDLSKLKKVNLRSVWAHEAHDFTKWLAEEENLNILSDEIGIDITLLQTEANVGNFNVDILAEEDVTKNKIIIENQLEITNHDHLGKLITYAAGYDAKAIIWIVKDVRDEHKQAIEWLNKVTDDQTGFFLIRIELWQIEDSTPAPKFEVIIRPNEWAKTIKTTSTNKNLTDTKVQQLEFWNKFVDYCKNTNSELRLRTPRPQHWYDFSMGSSDAHIGLTMNTRENLIGCEVYIARNKKLFEYLQSRSTEIEAQINNQIEWIDASVAARIKISKKVNNIFGGSQDEIFEWYKSNVLLFQTTFPKFINSFKAKL